MKLFDTLLAFCLGVALTMIVLLLAGQQHSSNELTPVLECEAGYQHYKRTGNTDRLSDECLADMR